MSTFKADSTRSPWLAPLFAALLVGCNSSGVESDTNATNVPAPVPAVTETSAESTPAPALDSTASVSIQTIDKQGFARFLEEHRGQVVLVDYWATWCPPCMEGFPDTVRLSERYAPQGLVVASMAIEDLENEAAVRTFLASQGGNITHFISAYGGSDGSAMREFEITSGTIPTIKLFDRQGQLRHTFGDGESFTFEQVEVALRELLLKAE
jgi:thiol-disulfide isomerase/thioredoxin